MDGKNREQNPKITQEVQEPITEKPHISTIDTGNYDSQSNPNAVEFDTEAYRATIVATDSINAMTEQLKESFAALSAIKRSDPTTAETTRHCVEQNAEVLKDIAATIITTAQRALTGIRELVNSDTYKAIKESVSTISSFVTQYRAEMKSLVDTAQEIRDLAPFLEIEFAEMQKDPQFTDYTLPDLLEQGFDKNGSLTDSPFRQTIERAMQRRSDFKAAEGTIVDIEQAAKELPRILSNPTDLLNYPLNKPNSKVWNSLTGADVNGQLALDIITSKKGSKQEAIVYYGIRFDELETDLKITKQLTPFDKRCYIATAALYNGGNDVISATQIYKMMGNAGQPKTDQIQKINDSLTKMGAARVYIDNTKEVQVNRKYNHFKYDASLLPFERISAYINNTLCEAAIHLFREPPLITFARERGQITGLTRQLLESPISKTDANLRLEDYLLERISHMKNPKSKAPRKMLYSTIYNQCGIITKKQKQRAPEKIRRYLEHYKKCSFIIGYKEVADGITIQV